MDNAVQRPLTPSESLIKACEEMKLIRERKLPLKDWRSIFDALEKDESNEDVLS